jgi:hypothetical protein
MTIKQKKEPLLCSRKPRLSNSPVRRRMDLMSTRNLVNYCSLLKSEATKAKHKMNAAMRVFQKLNGTWCLANHKVLLVQMEIAKRRRVDA